MGLFSDDNIERARLYKLFSSLLLHEPTDDLLLNTVNMLHIQVNDTASEIRMDFLQLFTDAAGQLPPYESLYNYEVWDTPRLWGKVTEEVWDSYRSANLAIDEETDLIPDHLSAELLFMSYLVEHKKTELQKSFLEEHLCIWVTYFCDDVVYFAQTTFYKQVAEILKELILSECEAFGMEIIED